MHQQSLNKEKIYYKEKNTSLEGYLAYSEEIAPIILVFHAWGGRNDFACQKAEELAALGYIGYAVDIYGKGVLGKSAEENEKLMTPFIEDRALLQRRILAGLESAKSLSVGDKTKIGAIGFCFGGLCALDLARSGADVKGIVSFHGLLNPPAGIEKNKIEAKVLCLHGHLDQMATPDDVQAFQKEMTEKNVDWQVHTFGQAMHGFTNPEANDPSIGVGYHPLSASRAWHEMIDFFKEIF